MTATFIQPMRNPLVLVGGIVAIILICFGSLLMASESQMTNVYGLIVLMGVPTVLGFLALLQAARNEVKVDQNTAITQNMRKDVRHDVAEKVNAATLIQQEAAKEVAGALVTENAAVKQQINDLKERLAVYSEVSNNINLKLLAIGEKRLAEPVPVQVVNPPENPVPTKEEGRA